MQQCLIKDKNARGSTNVQSPRTAFSPYTFRKNARGSTNVQSPRANLQRFHTTLFVKTREVQRTFKVHVQRFQNYIFRKNAQGSTNVQSPCANLHRFHTTLFDSCLE